MDNKRGESGIIGNRLLFTGESYEVSDYPTPSHASLTRRHRSKVKYAKTKAETPLVLALCFQTLDIGRSYLALGTGTPS